jgi:hypothetical protein
MRNKKEQDREVLLQKCVDPIFPVSLIDFDLRGDAASARQGSSRDLDHQTATLRPV